MIAGTYIVTGQSLERPEVHTLTGAECGALDSALALASKRGSERMRYAVLGRVFTPGTEYAYSASPEMCAHLARDYTGPHSEAVRAVAQLLALGASVSLDQLDDEPPSPKGPTGGQPARLVPEPPRKPPGGASAKPIPQALAF